ncbi:MAG TPA: M17 family peptidase N-terminal domain-containing protein, partial [bacterium]|nr:M17 family peptidase N-terminal domain-containing protein [bacterium]
MTPSFKFAEKPLADIKADLRVALMWQEAPLAGSARELDGLTAGALGKLLKAGTVKGSEGETFLYPLPGNKGFVLLLGLGKQADAKLNTVRAAGGHIVQAAQKGHFKSVAVTVPDFATTATLDQDDLALFCQALTEGVVLRDYEFEDLKKSKDPVWHL